MTPADSFTFAQAFQWMGNYAHRNACAKGFWKQRHELELAASKAGLGVVARKAIDSQLLALIHSEISEALEGDRKDLMDDKIPAFTAVEAELADVVIRIGDMAAARGLRVAQAIIAKMAMNETREPMHGKAF